MTQARPDLHVDDKDVKRMLDGVNLSAKQSKKAWRKFTQYMRVRTDQTFDRLRRGGSFRGVTWAPFKPQYVRQDGTVVPAWGGIAKVRGRGKVQGRLRPSNTRLTRGDSLMQDTMTMRQGAVSTVRATNESIEYGPVGLVYAAAQQRRRMFLFFEVPRDLKELVTIFAGHIRRGAKRGRP